MQERGPQVALLAALGVVVDPVRGDPVDRVADDVDQLGVGDGLGHPLGHAEVLRVGGVVGRGLAAAVGGGVEVTGVPLEPAREVALGDEEVELLRVRHRDLGMQARGSSAGRSSRTSARRSRSGSAAAAPRASAAAAGVLAGASMGGREGSGAASRAGNGRSATPSTSSARAPSATARSGLRPRVRTRRRSASASRSGTVGARPAATGGRCSKATPSPRSIGEVERVGDDEDARRIELADRRPQEPRQIRIRRPEREDHQARSAALGVAQERAAPQRQDEGQRRAHGMGREPQPAVEPAGPAGARRAALAVGHRGDQVSRGTRLRCRARPRGNDAGSAPPTAGSLICSSAAIIAPSSPARHRQPGPRAVRPARPRGLVVGVARHRHEQRRDGNGDQLVEGVVAGSGDGEVERAVE